MGYTRYWNRTKEPITQEFVDAVNKIIAECNANDIKICNWDGKGKPDVSLDGVRLNGDAKIGADHDSFVIENGARSFDFCKTAEKPYDYAVKRVLEVAEQMGLVEDVKSDGEAQKITDTEWVEYIEELKRKYPQYYS